MRRWTGIEPAGRRCFVPTALKAAESTRHSDTSGSNPTLIYSEPVLAGPGRYARPGRWRMQRGATDDNWV